MAQFQDRLLRLFRLRRFLLSPDGKYKYKYKKSFSHAHTMNTVSGLPRIAAPGKP